MRSGSAQLSFSNNPLWLTEKPRPETCLGMRRLRRPVLPAHGTENVRRITPPTYKSHPCTIHPRVLVRLQESTRKDRTGPPAPASSLGSLPEASEPTSVEQELHEGLAGIRDVVFSASRQDRNSPRHWRRTGSTPWATSLLPPAP